MEHTSRVCGACNTLPTKQADGVLRCGCPDKQWYEPGQVQADAKTEALLRQKGFVLTGGGSYYYYRESLTIFILSDGTWRLEGAEPTIANLREHLMSMPDEPSPGASVIRL